MNKKWLLAAIMIAGIGYLFALQYDQMLLRWILKPGTMLLIMWYAATKADSSGKYKRLIVAGLLFSVTGDVFLLLKGNLWFVLGLFSFLIGHVIYITAFVQRRQFSRMHVLVLIPIILYAVFLLNGLHGGIFADETKGYEGLWIPVIAYVIVISSMLWCATISRNKLAVTGAILFVISDSLLAWNMFVTPMPWLGRHGVMITYYLAQFLIASSIGGVEKKHTVNEHRVRLH